MTTPREGARRCPPSTARPAVDAPTTGRTIARWMVSFVGLPARRLRRHDPRRPGRQPRVGRSSAACVTGAVLGAVQAWALRAAGPLARRVDRRPPPSAWRSASPSARPLVDYATGLGALVVQGAVSGARRRARPGRRLLRRRLGAARAGVAGVPRRRLGARLGRHHLDRRRGRRPVHRLRRRRRRRRHRCSPSVLPARRSHRRQQAERVMSRHVVFGTGQVGRPLVEQLVAARPRRRRRQPQRPRRPPRRHGRRRRRHRPRLHHRGRAPARTSSTSASTR